MQDESLEWCRLSFSANYGDDGRRGFKIVVERHADGGLSFFFLCRSVDRQHENTAFQTPYAVSLCTRTGILHCPWCGEHLASWYADMYDLLPK